MKGKVESCDVGKEEVTAGGRAASQRTPCEFRDNGNEPNRAVSPVHCLVLHCDKAKSRQG